MALPLRPDAAPSANIELPVPWRVGEHVFIAGDTGQGKTYLIARLIQLRKYVLFIRTKLQDDTPVPGLVRVTSATAMQELYSTRLLLEPPYKRQYFEVMRALEAVWQMGGWTVVIDEEFYVERKLRIIEPIEMLATQGRSHKITVVIGSQRPSRITRFAIAESTHVFSFRLEGRDVLTLKEATTPKIVPAIESLSGHRFAYYHRGKRIVATGDARRLNEIIATPNVVE